MIVPTEAHHELKVPVVQHPDYTLYLERTSGLTFIHCDVWSRWSPQVKRSLHADVETLKKLHREPIHALHDPSDTKHEKFIKQLGFEFAAFFISPSGQPTEIYRIQG